MPSTKKFSGPNLTISHLLIMTDFPWADFPYLPAICFISATVFESATMPNRRVDSLFFFSVVGLSEYLHCRCNCLVQVCKYYVQDIFNEQFLAHNFQTFWYTDYKALIWTKIYTCYLNTLYIHKKRTLLCMQIGTCFKCYLILFEVTELKLNCILFQFLL